MWLQVHPLPRARVHVVRLHVLRTTTVHTDERTVYIYIRISIRCIYAFDNALFASLVCALLLHRVRHAPKTAGFLVTRGPFVPAACAITTWDGSLRRWTPVCSLHASSVSLDLPLSLDVLVPVFLQAGEGLTV